MAGVEGKDRGIHKEDKTGGFVDQKRTRISHFIPVWTVASCSCGSSPKTGEVDKDTKIDLVNPGKERRMRQIPWQTMKNIWNRRQRRHLVS